MAEANANAAIEAYDPQEFLRQVRKLDDYIGELKSLGINTVDLRELSGPEGMAGCARFSTVDHVTDIKIRLFAQGLSEG